MKLNEQDIRDGLKDRLESPSYGFHLKTMRLIEEQQNLFHIYKPVRISKWVLSIIFSAFIFCFGFSFTLTNSHFPIFKDMDIDFTLPLPEIYVFWMWGLSFAFVALGLWISIFWLHFKKFKF